MILYKYTNIDIGSKILLNNSVRFTQQQYLNDPYDMKPDFSEANFDYANDGMKLSDFGENQNEVKTELIEGYYRIINSEFGIFCLTESYDNTIMWSHYADNHRGIAIGFDADNVFLNDNNEKITLNRVKYNLCKYKIKIVLDPDELHQSLFEKSKDWEYENEWRSIRLLKDADSICGDVHLFSFDSSIIKEIYLGANIAQNYRDSIVKLVKSKYQQTNIYQIELDNSSYKLKSQNL